MSQLVWYPTESVKNSNGSASAFGDGTRWELWDGDSWLGTVIRWPYAGVEAWSIAKGRSVNGLPSMREAAVALLKMSNRLEGEPLRW